MPSSTPKIPYAGFRVVFALINGVIWFALGYGISSAVSPKIAASGRFGPEFVAAGAATVAFMVGFFGWSGALTGLLDMARSGKLALPSKESWGSRGQLDHAWLRGLVTGSALAAFAAAAFHLVAPSIAGASRNATCLLLGVTGAVLGIVQAAIASRPSSLADLSAVAIPRAADGGYLLRRVALPQGFGNGLITALIAAGTFAPADMVPLGFAADAGGTTLIIGAFMLTSGAALVATDRALGRVAARPGAPPSRTKQVALLLGATLLSAAVGYVLAASAGAHFDSLGYAVWKGVLGFVAGASLAWYAGLAALRRGAASSLD